MVRKSMIAALAMVTAGAIALPHVAFAAPLAQPNQSRTAEVAKGDVNIEPVAQYWRKKKPGYARYDQRRHGDRYSYRHGGYRHYHNGYYYSSPWWVAGPLIGGALLGAYAAPRIYDNENYDNGYGNGHVEWCLNRYQSYNPNSDTFLGYDGRYHRCNSPY
jgi:hypothetical protein